MSGLQVLQEALSRWVRVERPSGEPRVKISQAGIVDIYEVNYFPEAPADAQHEAFSDGSPDRVRANVHFIEIAPTPDFPDREELIATVKDALGEGEWATLTAADLAGGPSYVTLGGWLGSQDLALMLIGAVELAGIAPAVTPELLGMTGELADQMAGNGLVMLGPAKVWEES